ncbi:exported hypothetical protein [Candidatus Defluviicoccus seviourii]|uniref:SH3b domain-containing protein n=1 Tax=Candidatus Defluviicoccus seviourii TaxID=2565273 RepID=A0A564WJ14_9PROT|nr:exported hypothetical protein [Candidatus Defluviicoccus seviourii]
MRGGRLFPILGAGIAAAVLVAMMSGGKQASAPVVVELAMPPVAKPPASPAPSLLPSDVTSAQKAAPNAGGATGATPEVLTSAPPPGSESAPATASPPPPEPAPAAEAPPQTNGGLPMVVTRGSNMRAEPSVNAPLIAHFTAGERVYRMEEKAVLGYYLVRSDKATGWIWWTNVAEDQQPPSR